MHPPFGHCSPPGTTASSAALDAPPAAAATLAPTTGSPSTAYTTDGSETSSPRPGWRFDVASAVFFRLLAAAAATFARWRFVVAAPAAGATFARWRFVVAAPAAGALGSPSHAKLRVSPTATATGYVSYKISVEAQFMSSSYILCFYVQEHSECRGLCLAISRLCPDPPGLIRTLIIALRIS